MRPPRARLCCGLMFPCIPPQSRGRSELKEATLAHGGLTLVVLAAGIGSRYGGLKQVDPIGPHGEMIIDYSVFDALRAGFDRVVFVISREIEEAFRDRVGRTVERQCDTAYVFQRIDDLPPGMPVPPGRKKPWGTAHATLCSQPAVHSPFSAINADDFYGRTAFAAIADFLSAGRPGDGVPAYCMVGYRLGNTLTEHGHVARGVCTVDKDGCLLNIREIVRIERADGAARHTEDSTHWSALPLDTTVSMNMWGFRPDLYAELAARFPRFLEANRDNLEKAEFFLPTVVGELIAENRATVRVLKTDEQWHGVTYAADKERVKAAIADMVRQGLYPEKLWEDRT
jgi:hypothetical protein